MYSALHTVVWQNLQFHGSITCSCLTQFTADNRKKEKLMLFYLLYRELEHTIHFGINGDLTINYHCLLNGFNKFFGHLPHQVVYHMQLSLIAFLKSLNELVYYFWGILTIQYCYTGWYRQWPVSMLLPHKVFIKSSLLNHVIHQITTTVVFHSIEQLFLKSNANRKDSLY